MRVGCSHAHKHTVMQLKWNRNGNWLLTASRDHLIKLFDIRNMKEEVQAFKGHKKEATGRGGREGKGEGGEGWETRGGEARGVQAFKGHKKEVTGRGGGKGKGEGRGGMGDKGRRGEAR